MAIKSIFQNIKSGFKNLKWYEYIIVCVILAVILSVGIIFKSNALIMANSILGILTVFTIGKGLVVGQFFGVIQAIIYCFLAFFNAYYGEIIVCICMTIPTYIIGIVFWLKNQNASNIVNVNKNRITLLEWLISLLVSFLIGVCGYFLLRYFDTANLWINVTLLVTSAIAGYLMIKRSEFNFIFYIINNILSIVLWIYVVVKVGDMSYIPTVLNYVVFFLINLFAVFNWVKIKNKQIEENKDFERKEIENKENE